MQRFSLHFKLSCSFQIKFIYLLCQEGYNLGTDAIQPLYNLCLRKRDTFIPHVTAGSRKLTESVVPFSVWDLKGQQRLTDSAAVITVKGSLKDSPWTTSLQCRKASAQSS